MAIPYSNTHTPYQSPFQSALQSELDDVLEVLNDLTAVIESEAELREQIPAFSGDSATRSSQQVGSFISEELRPMLAPITQNFHENSLPIPTQASPKADDVRILAQPHNEEIIPPAVEDKNITANYLFALNPMEKVMSEMQAVSAQAATRRALEERDQMKRVSQVQRQDQHGRQSDEQRQSRDQQDDPEEALGPMIEAMVHEMPQVSITLPGGIELRIVVNVDGRPSVMYVTPEGTLRTLPKGKTLRFNRWVNGLTIHSDGRLAFTP